MWGYTKGSTWGCTGVAPVVALVGAVINGQMCTKWFIYSEPVAALEGALDGGLNVGFE